MAVLNGPRSARTPLQIVHFHDSFPRPARVSLAPYPYSNSLSLILLTLIDTKHQLQQLENKVGVASKVGVAYTCAGRARVPCACPCSRRERGR